MGILQSITSNIHLANGIASPLVDKAAASTSGLFDLSDIENRQNSPIDAPIGSTLYQRLYAVQVAVYRCVWIWANSIAQLGMVVETPDGDNEFKNISDNPEFAVFKNPNEWQTIYDFIESTITYLQTTGEFFWFLNIQGGKVKEMFPLRPDLVEIVPGSELLIKEYLFKPDMGGDEIHIPPECIYHFKLFNPLDNFRGLSPISAALGDITTDLGASASQKKTLENGARPTGIMSSESDELDKDTLKAIRKVYREEYEGPRNAGKIMFTGYGFKYNQISLSSKDAQLLETRGWTVDQVQTVYGVPDILMMKFETTAVISNTRVQYKLMWDSIVPVLTKLEAGLNTFFLPMVTNDTNARFRFDTSEVAALQADKNEKSKRMNDAFPKGAFTPNDLRVAEGFEREDNDAMDLHYMPLNMIPIDELAFFGDPEEEAEKSLINSVSRRINEQYPIEITAESISESIKNINLNAEKSKQLVKRINVEASINAIIRTIRNGFVPKLMGFFKEQMDEVLSNIDQFRNYKESSILAQDIVIDVDKWNPIFAAEGKHWLTVALEEALKDIHEEIGGEAKTIQDLRLEGFINQEARMYATVTNKNTVTQIDKLVSKGVVNGDSLEDIASSITKFFKSQSRMRAERIARTEGQRAVNQGRHTFMGESVLVTNTMWLSQRDKDVRHSHSDADGRVVAKGTSYGVNDPTMSSPLYPSAINERCYETPTNEPVNYPMPAAALSSKPKDFKLNKQLAYNY